MIENLGFGEIDDDFGNDFLKYLVFEVCKCFPIIGIEISWKESWKKGRYRAESK